MNKDLMFSSKKNDYETPQDFFDELNKEFDFTLDACATRENSKCLSYYTKNENGLNQSWAGERVFVNPPYGRQIYCWVEKCYYESQFDNTFVVLLIPARTDTKYFHDFIWNEGENDFYLGVKVRFVKGRLKFGDSKNAAPFPSVIVIFNRSNILGKKK